MSYDTDLAFPAIWVSPFWLIGLYCGLLPSVRDLSRFSSFSWHRTVVIYQQTLNNFRMLKIFLYRPKPNINLVMDNLHHLVFPFERSLHLGLCLPFFTYFAQNPILLIMTTIDGFCFGAAEASSALYCMLILTKGNQQEVKIRLLSTD